ncbi:MAG: hypothetical protein WBM14_00795 [Terracidiphilus sp.]
MFLLLLSPFFRLSETGGGNWLHRLAARRINLTRAWTNSWGHLGDSKRPPGLLITVPAAREPFRAYAECSSQDLFFSPSAFQASLQTGIVQASNRTTGAAMSLLKKSDLKNHLSARQRNGLHPFRPVNKPGATGFSEIEQGGTRANTPSFVEDFYVEHSSSGVSIIPIEISAGPGSIVIAGTPKSPQA